jgi:PAS domain S-box-containing protein
MATVNHSSHALIQSAPDPVFLIDTEGTIIETNDRASALLDYDRAELEGMDVLELHPSKRSESYRVLFERTRNENVVQTDELDDGSQLYLVTHDDDRVPIELHARAVTLEGRRRLYAIVRDITEQHEQRRKLRRQNDRLEKFASIVSHDLRNPLNVARGRLDLVENEVDSEHLDAIANAHERMDDLITNLLALAREQELTTNLEPVALGRLCEDCWRTVETSDATLENDATTLVEADESRLRQLIENLVSNAVEHGSEEVTIRIDDLPDGFYVADDGPGIPPEHRDHVFETGYSTDSDGTGFGLSIVKEIVDDHGWEITITESADDGARFEITGVTFPVW